MQCANCGFENMPGIATCVGCGAPLELRAGRPEYFVPPRAGRWKVLRPLLYLKNRLFGRIAVLDRANFLIISAPDMTRQDLLAMVLSLVPGLGHAAAKRWRAACIAFVGWLLLFAATASLYSGLTRGVLSGLLVSWHTMVMMDAGRLLRTARRFSDRWMVTVLLCLALAFLYSLIPNPRMLVSAGSFPTLEVQPGDTLWGWPGNPEAELHRNDLVFLRARGGRRRNLGGGGEGYVLDTSHGRTVGCLVGLPGEEVVVTSEGISIDDRLLESPNLPGNDYLLLPDKGEIRVKVRDNVYMVVYSLYRRRLRLGPLSLRDVCEEFYGDAFLVEREDIVGRSLGVYLPIRNRHLF